MKEEVRREEGKDGVEGNQEGGGGGGQKSGLMERKRDNRGGAKQRGKGREERRGLPSTYPHPPGGSDATR